MTRFRDVQQEIIMATVWIDDDETKSGYNIKKKTWNCVRVVKPNDQDVRHQWRRDNQDQHSAHETRHLTKVVFLLVHVVLIFTHCTPHRVAQVVRVSHLIHAWSERHSSTLSSPFHPTSSSPCSSSISPQLLLTSYFHEVSGNTAYSANKEVGSMDESYRHEPKAHYLMETDVESFTESLTQSQFSEQRFLDDVGLRWRRARGHAL